MEYASRALRGLPVTRLGSGKAFFWGGAGLPLSDV